MSAAPHARMPDEPVNSEGLREGILKSPATAWVVFGVALIVTAGLSRVAKEFADRQAADRFEFRAREITQAIENRMLFYEQALWGGVGLFNASNIVSREEWNRYVEAIKINERLPGIQGLGFAVPVLPENKDAHIAKIRSEGFPEYTITPAEPRDNYTAIIYLAPFDFRNQRAFGYDMWSNENRRQAMKRTRDFGTSTTSGIITLVQEMEEDIQRGFLTYTPVYANDLPSAPTIEQRRDKFVGWVYAAFRAGDLMRGVLGSSDRAFQLEIYDSEQPPAAENLLFASGAKETTVEPSGAAEALFSSVTSLLIQGREWTVHIRSTPEFSTGSPPILPPLVAIFGLIVSALLFVITRTAHNINSQAKTKARQMTAEIRAQSQMLVGANTQLRQFAYAATHDVKTPINHVGNALRLIHADTKELSDQQRRAIEWIESGHQRATEILEKLMEVVQLNEGARMASIEFDIAEAVKRRLEYFRGDLTDIGAEVDLSRCTGRVDFPQEIFSRVVDNLLSNAIKYRDPDRQLLLSISHETGAENSTLTICDNGLGIDMDKHGDKIFGMFKRAHDHVEGSGFGLYISKQLVEVYGGELTCTSQTGKGSCFSITFPTRPKPHQ